MWGVASSLSMSTGMVGGQGFRIVDIDRGAGDWPAFSAAMSADSTT